MPQSYEGKNRVRVNMGEAPVDIKTKEIQEVSTQSYIVLYCAHRPCCVEMHKLQ